MNSKEFVINGQVIRHGDQVFIINQHVSDWDWQDSVRRLTLSLDEYRCPFSILYQFDEWWEWHRLTIWMGQPTGRVMVRMVNDIETINAHKIERPMVDFRAYDFPPTILEPRNIIRNFTT